MSDKRSKKYLKDTNYLKKYLGNHLAKFENLTEWPDFGNWLQKTAKFLEDHPTPDIPYKLILAKRLAQCLNSGLPHGTHKITLSVYVIVFRNMRLSGEWIKHMPLFCIGLFPFFQNCSIQVKPEFIALIYDNFLQMGIELIPMLTGLVTSLLPGLEEQDENLQKRVLKLLSGIKQSVGQRFLIGAVWIAILKTPKVRMSAIKFLNKELKKIGQLQAGEGDNVIQQKRRQNSMKIIEKAQNREWKDDPESQMEKKLFDELIMSIKESVNQDTFYFPSGAVISSACLACLEDTQVIVRRSILDFIGTYIPLKTTEYLSHDEKLILVEGTIKLFKKKDMSINRRIYKWLFGGDVDNEIEINESNEYNFMLLIEAMKHIFDEKKNTPEEAVLPIKMMGNIFIEHEELTEVILNELAAPFILYFYQTVVLSKDDTFRKDVRLQGMKLIDNLADYMSLLLKSFRSDIITEGRTQLEVMKILKFLINSFLQNQGSDDDRRRANHLRIALISVLGQANQVHLSGIGSINKEELELLNICARAIKEQTEALNNITSENIIAKRETAADESFVANLVTFTENITDMLRALNEDMPKQLEKFKGLFRDCISLLIKSFDYTQNLQPLEGNTLPEWLKQMCLILKHNPPHLGHICLRYLLKIIQLGKEEEDAISESTAPSSTVERRMTTSNMIIKSTVWLTIRAILLSKGLKDVLDFTLEKELAEQVWAYFHISENSKESVSMILKLCESSSEFIVNHIKSLLKTENLEEADESYRQFAIFWKATQDISCPEVKLLKYQLVFDMLSFLDATNPLHRYSSKGWLFSCVQKLETIVNPIFEHILAATDWECETDQFYYYEKEFPTDLICNAFKYLKDMLIVMGPTFLNYFSKTATSPILNYLIPKLKEKKLIGAQFPLIDMLCLTSLRFIQGRCGLDLSKKFKQENLSVKAVACEFLEMVLSKLDDLQMRQQISCYLMHPVVRVLKIAVENEESGILIQLISVLNVILFKSKLHEESKNDKGQTRARFIGFLEAPIFIETLLKGLKSRVLYILTEFRNFANNTLIILSETLRHPNLTDLVKKILSVYYNLIARRGKPASEALVKSNFSDNPITKSLESMMSLTNNSSARNNARLMVLMEGLEYALQLFVGTDNVRNQEIPQDDNVLLSIITLGLASRGNKKSNEKFFKKHENVGKSILNDMGAQLDAFRGCWYPGRKFRDCVNLTNRGCMPFSMDKLKPYIVGSFEEKVKGINSKIIAIIRPFGKRFMTNLVGELLTYWIFSFKKSSAFDGSVSNRLSTIIEIISESSFHPIEFLQSLAKTEIIKTIQKNNHGFRKKLLKKNTKLTLKIDQSRREVIILYFIYNYLRYMKLDYSDGAEVRTTKYMAIWSATSRLLAHLAESISLDTSFWILEIFSLLSNKFNISDLMSRVYNDYYKVLNSTIGFISKFTVNNSKINMSQLMIPGNVITPLCPALYKLDYKFKDSQELLNDTKFSIESQLLQDKFKFDQEIIKKYKYQAFKVLSELVKTPLFLQGESTKLDRLLLRIRELSANTFLSMKNRAPENLYFVESASEVIYNLMITQPNKYIVRELKKDVLEVFNTDSFFRCTPNTLKYWSKIIDMMATMGKEDLLQNYLRDVNFSSLFKSKTSEDKTRIRCFERVCFIIYSGEVDKYMTKKKIKALLEKIREVIKAENAHQSLLILIMFCLRVLILRLSSLNLNELFRNIWPILLTLLIKIFGNHGLHKDNVKKTNIHVVLAGLKLLELLSVCNIEEFNIYQWIFIYDYFGVSIDTSAGLESNKLKDVDTKKLISPLAFKPFLSSCIPEGLVVDYLGSAFKQKQYKNTSSKKEKRRILITQNHLETEFELQAKAQELLTYLIFLNQTRVYVDPEDIETLIQNDFIGMNSMFI